LNVVGTIAPGDGLNGNLGTLTVTNTVNLFNVAWMKLNRAASPNSDCIVATNINYGGTLIVTNVGAALQPGDTFTLFRSANPPAGAFTLVLPNYYTWDTSNLGVNGTITVVGTFRPVIDSVDFSTLSGGFITISATNGAPNGPVNVLMSTNLALPLSSWQPVTTNVFDGLGNYVEAIPVDPAAPQEFYILRAR
jgi:hypothetical protein